MYLVHSAEIVGYKNPDRLTAAMWLAFYEAMCRKLHMTPETEAQLDSRLDAQEDAFAAAQ